MYIYVTPEIGVFAEDEAASTNQHQGLERKEDIIISIHIEDKYIYIYICICIHICTYI